MKIGERVAAYNAGYTNMFTFIDERDEEPRKCKAYRRNVRKYRTGVSEAVSSNDSNPSEFS